MSANRSCTSIDSLPAETSQTAQSCYYKYNISKLIWHLCKIWQSYPINCFDHDAAVTDNASSTSSAQSSLHASLWAHASQYPQHYPTAVTSPITHYRSLQKKKPNALWNLKERNLPVKHQQKMSSYQESPWKKTGMELQTPIGCAEGGNGEQCMQRAAPSLCFQQLQFRERAHP